MANATRNPDRFAHLQGKTRWGRCDLCGLEYPESKIKTQDGMAVCVDDWEPQGLGPSRDRERTRASRVASRLTAKARPPKYVSQDGISYAGFGAAQPGVTSFDPDPFTLVAGGAAVELELTGVNLSTDDTITYGHAEITDSIAPVVTATLVTLTLVAGAACPVGQHSLTYNDQYWPYRINVR